MRLKMYINSKLIIAFQEEDEEALKAFMESEDFDCNMTDCDEISFFMYACTYGLVNITKKLIQMPSLNVNAKGRYGYTALIGACRRGHVEIVKLLLSIKEIDVNYNNNNMESALSVSCSNGNTKIVKELMRQKNLIYYTNALLYAADHDHKDIVIMLWPYYKNVNSRNADKIINEHIIFVGKLLEAQLPIELVRLIMIYIY